MTRRLSRGHSAGAGLVLGLLVAQRPLWIFGAGVVAGVALVFAVRALRKAARGARLVARVLERIAGGPAGAPVGKEDGGREELPPAALTEEECERERRLGLRQGQAAGIRAAARLEIRDRVRREAMQRALDDHWRGERRRSVERAVRP